MVDNYPGNSNNPKPSPDVEKVEEATRKVEKVVEGSVSRRKKPLGRRFAETFIGGNAKSVAGYIVFEVLIPAAKDTIADVFTQGIERMLFGDSPRSATRRAGGGYRPSGPSGYVNYNKFSSRDRYSRDRDYEETRMSDRGRASFDFDEIVLDSRDEADEVLSQLFELISTFEKATVADLYDLTGIDSKHTDYNWGWRDLRGSRVVRVRSGYLLDLPKPEPLRNNR